MITTQPTDTFLRVYRGGSWNFTSAALVRAAFRFGDTPLYRVIDIGFRCSQRGCRQVLKAGVTQ